MTELPKRNWRKGKWANENKFVVHRDMQEALMHYHPDRDSIQQCFRERDEKVEKGEDYHNSDHDAEMTETARENSQNPEWWLGTGADS